MANPHSPVIMMDTIDVQHVVDLGQALYGRNWGRSVARLLGVHPATVCRWKQGVGAPSVDDLEALLTETRRQYQVLKTVHDRKLPQLQLAKPQPPPPAGFNRRPDDPWRPQR